MTWVVWRQHRALLLIALGALAATGATLVALRTATAGAITDLGIGPCLRADPTSCPEQALSAVETRFQLWFQWVPFLLLAVPTLVGVLAGAALFARDVEQRSHLFTLTQSVSRGRWWAVKVAVVGLPLVGAGLLLGLVARVTWEPLDWFVHSTMRTPLFEAQGPVVGASVLVGFAVAAGLGLVLRNTVGAIAAGLVVHIVLLTGVGLVGPVLFPPAELTAPLAAAPAAAQQNVYDRVPTGSLPSEDGYRDDRGTTVVPDWDACLADGTDDVRDCARATGATVEWVRFVPPSHFWPLQLIETGLAVAVAGLALALGRQRLRRRVV